MVVSDLTDKEAFSGVVTDGDVLMNLSSGKHLLSFEFSGNGEIDAKQNWVGTIELTVDGHSLGSFPAEFVKHTKKAVAKNSCRKPSIFVLWNKPNDLSNAQIIGAKIKVTKLEFGSPKSQLANFSFIL